MFARCDRGRQSRERTIQSLRSWKKWASPAPNSVRQLTTKFNDRILGMNRHGLILEEVGFEGMLRKFVDRIARP